MSAVDSALYKDSSFSRNSATRFQKGRIVLHVITYKLYKMLKVKLCM